MGTDLIRCPKCGGRVNKLWPMSIRPSEEYVDCIAECWSGDEQRKSHHHLFLVKVKLAGKIVHGDEVITVTEELAMALEAGNIDVEKTLWKAIEDARREQ